MSHDLLDDLLADVPRHVGADPRRAWRTGSRRRRRQYAAEGLAIAAAVAAVAWGLAQLHDRTPVQPAGHQVGLDGHPAVVPRPFFAQDLPDRPGPLAGLLEHDGEWLGVDQNGRTWRIEMNPGSSPALSDDGNHLGRLVPTGRHTAVYETVNLTTGVRTTYDVVGNGNTENGRPLTDQPYFAGIQQPAYWSPDGTRLLVPGGGMGSGPPSALLLEDGTAREVVHPGIPVGWASPTQLVWLSYAGTRAQITDLTGATLRNVPMATTTPIHGVDQYSGRVSPDGTRLAVIDVEGPGPDHPLSTFSLLARPSGGATSLPSVRGAEEECPLTWHGNQVAAWTTGGLRDQAAAGPREVVAVSERWHGAVSCGTWAADAMAGSAQAGPGLTEWRYWPLWYWWRQLAIALAAVVVAVAALRAHRRRAREPHDSGA
jgi:hypothetical protein